MRRPLWTSWNDGCLDRVPSACPRIIWGRFFDKSKPPNLDSRGVSWLPRAFPDKCLPGVRFLDGLAARNGGRVWQFCVDR